MNGHIFFLICYKHVPKLKLKFKKKKKLGISNKSYAQCQSFIKKNSFIMNSIGQFFLAISFSICFKKMNKSYVYGSPNSLLKTN